LTTELQATAHHQEIQHKAGLEKPVARVLPQQLGLLDASMINIGTMLGSGIFFVPTTIALYLHSTSLIMLVWIVGGVVSLLGALSVAELGAAMPRAGGQYVYLTEAYGKIWGFLYGWTTFTVINTASIAAVSVAFATYLGYFIHLGPVAIKVVAILGILSLTAINCLGIKSGALVQNSLTCLKIGAMMALVAFSFLLRGGSPEHFSPVLPGTEINQLFGPLGLAMIAVLWSYDGWIQITYVAGEIRNPQKNIPQALLISTLTMIAIYLLVNLAYHYVLPMEQITQSKLVASDAAKVLLGPIGGSLIAAAVMISTYGANNGFILTGARVYYAMAREGLFFPCVAKLHGAGIPRASLLIQGVWASMLTLTGSFDQLFTYVIFASWLFYAMSCGAVLILRQKAKDMPRPYRTWGYPFTPILFILFALWLVVNAIIQDPRDSAIGAGIILLGLPAYFYWTRRNR
jgi:basic amino acid/polyamine antiporter, APA family